MLLIQIPKVCGVKYLCLSIKIWSGWQKGGTRLGVASAIGAKIGIGEKHPAILRNYNLLEVGESSIAKKKPSVESKTEG